MAYVGNPVDTQNTFQSLQGKRFSGDGSTTAFTLDVAPGNVLDIEVFVGNVRQDPNSAYTLSGTTLTFTGAPPSGTNNIYVVHQAKSVGTIDVPSSFLSSEQTFTGGLDINGTELKLDADADTSITADTDDQIDIKIAGADDFQFTANTFTAQSGSTITTPTLGVINAHDLGAGIHIKTADSGASVSSDADELVIENGTSSGSAGISFLSATDGQAQICFGDSGDNNIGIIFYDHSNNSMKFRTNASERLRLDNSGNLFLGVTSASGFNGSTFKVPDGFSVYRNTSTGGNGVLLFYSDANSTGGNVGYFTANGGLANYQSNNVNLSDERLKKDIVDCPSTWDKIKSLKVRNFKYKEDNDERVVTGLIAQETETVDSNLVNSTNGLYGREEEQKDGKFKQIYTTDLYHQMLKTLQESQTRIETLETEMTALKARVTKLEE